MSNTFLDLSDAMLRAEEVQTSWRLVYQIRGATSRVLESAKYAGEREEGKLIVAYEEGNRKQEGEEYFTVSEDAPIAPNYQDPTELPTRWLLPASPQHTSVRTLSQPLPQPYYAYTS